MIAVSSSGKSFRALAWYLANGRSGGEQDRVAWSTSRNLPTTDPELAGTIMRATAAQSDRVIKPVYHVALSFDPADQVDRAAMERVADRLLERLGLAEHQAVIVCHRDREHPHLHVLINRVHPETGKAWERWKDRPLIQAILRDEERALGIREVAGTLAPSREQNVQGSLFEEARSHLAGRGSSEIRPASREANGSAEARRRTRVAELVEAIQQFERSGELSRRRLSAEIGIATSQARLAELEAAEAHARTAHETLMKSLGSVYRDPESAKRALNALAAEKGVAEAAKEMRSAPQRLGELLTVSRPRMLGLVPARDDSQARNAAGIAAVKARSAFEADRTVQTLTLGASAARRDAESVALAKRALKDEVSREPRRDELERRIGALMAKLLPWELVRLKALLTAPQFALAQGLRAAARGVVLGRDD